ncbi:hypothetical protein ACIO87_16045 [Streptomyces sp. NPDC087218]|uniref:hypothetical protein n=1 Tax=Streptomyces sp. NPDC087218 TaxID=3365769 RepID=UPI003821EEB8
MQLADRRRELVAYGADAEEQLGDDLPGVRPGVRPQDLGLPSGGRAVDLPGLDGYGAVAVARTPRGPVLLGRTAKGLIRLRTPDGTVVRRQGPPASDGPALRVGKDGRPVVAPGPDALPRVRRP